MRNGPSRLRQAGLDGLGDALATASASLPGGGAAASASANGSPAPENGVNGSGSNGTGAGGHPAGSLASLLAQLSGSVPDPFNIAGTFMPSSHSTSAHPLLSALAAPGGSLVAAAIAGASGNGNGSAGGGGGSGSGGSGGVGGLAGAAVAASFFTTSKRKTGGGRQQPGLPPQHYAVQSGTYAQFGKSVAGLSALRGDEIEGDLGEVRRKRMRLGGRGRRNQNKQSNLHLIDSGLD